MKDESGGYHPVWGALKSVGMGAAGVALLFMPGHEPEALVGTPNNLQARLHPGIVNPKGTLVLLGGGISASDSPMEAAKKKGVDPMQLEPEDYDPHGVFRQMADRFDMKGRVVTCITSASEDAKEVGESCRIIFSLLGAQKVNIVDASSREEAERDSALIDAHLRESSFVFISGGKQDVLAHILGNSAGYRTLVERYATQPDFVLAGTSAGAMVASEHMIDGGDQHSVVERMKAGFGMVPVVVDTHFTSRNRMPRLEAALREHPERYAIGLDDATGIVLQDGKAEVIGRGNVTTLSLQDGEMSQCQYREGDSFLLGEHAHCPAYSKQRYKAPALAER